MGGAIGEAMKLRAERMVVRVAAGGGGGGSGLWSCGIVGYLDQLSSLLKLVTDEPVVGFGEKGAIWSAMDTRIADVDGGCGIEG